MASLTAFTDKRPDSSTVVVVQRERSKIAVFGIVPRLELPGNFFLLAVSIGLRPKSGFCVAERNEPPVQAVREVKPAFPCGGGCGAWSKKPLAVCDGEKNANVGRGSRSILLT